MSSLVSGVPSLRIAPTLIGSGFKPCAVSSCLVISICCTLLSSFIEGVTNTIDQYGICYAGYIYETF